MLLLHEAEKLLIAVEVVDGEAHVAVAHGEVLKTDGVVV